MNDLFEELEKSEPSLKQLVEAGDFKNALQYIESLPYHEAEALKNFLLQASRLLFARSQNFCDESR